jgi:hypothetical protein
LGAPSADYGWIEDAGREHDERTFWTLRCSRGVDTLPDEGAVRRLDEVIAEWDEG